jgi:hypothetical protein
MPQQKLNLFQFPALRAAELRRRASLSLFLIEVFLNYGAGT